MKTAIYKRRLIQQHQTLYVAIPKPWASANSLERYCTVDVSLNSDGTLTIAKEAQHDHE